MSSAAGREKLAFLLLLLIARSFRAGVEPPTVTELAVRLRIPPGAVQEFMELLSDLKLVKRLADQDAFIMARDPATIPLKTILDRLRLSGAAPAAKNNGEEEQTVDALLAQVDGATARALQGQTLQTLVAALDGARGAQCPPAAEALVSGRETVAEKTL